MFRSLSTRITTRKKALATATAVLLGASAAVLGTTGAASADSGSPQQVARQIVPAGQYASFSQIVSHESGWNFHATNTASGAYGLVQALPGSKMASAGPDWKTNPATQIKWGLNYMDARYGSPNAAWAFWQTHGWY
ncbi:transglycosylase SLT domain-containing protein [Streptomyces sp. NPDC026092]|uniref:aggregation-promoting factor C-terminal-like domain-containing protein n=1 Tax=Streptomyces sp. NPDC026092 TaxID=3154797 RepID=UPI0034092967